jgi:hypothetical protein
VIVFDDISVAAKEGSPDGELDRSGLVVSSLQTVDVEGEGVIDGGEEYGDK